jgi:hypothetical protein
VDAYYNSVQLSALGVDAYYNSVQLSVLGVDAYLPRQPTNAVTAENLT